MNFNHDGQSFREFPLIFIPNIGQMEKKIHFYVHGTRNKIFCTAQEVMFADQVNHPLLTPSNSHAEFSLEKTSLTLQFFRPNPEVKLEGLNEGKGKIHYLIGNDPAKWYKNIPIYYGLAYRELWTGVDLFLEGRNGKLKYTFVVQPQIDPQIIRFTYRGAKHLFLDEKGNLKIQTYHGMFTDKKPMGYQFKGGVKVDIATSFFKETLETGESLYGFQIGEDYDPCYPLIIDPDLLYSTYLGGSGDDEAVHIAVDSSGYAYVIGSTNSLNFPVVSGSYSQVNHGGLTDVFVTKINPGGSSIVYSTYIGGSGFDQGCGIAVDSSGHAYITGSTDSPDFPTTPGAFQTALAGLDDAFITKLSPDGSTLVYSTYLGGSGEDGSSGISIDSSGHAFVTGETSSLDFPVTPGSFSTTYNGGSSDVYVTKLDPAGASLLYSTYLGGSGDDESFAITVDASGNVYLAGDTDSLNFPVTSGAFSTAYNGGMTDAFISKLNPSGTSLMFSTYLGGSGFDRCCGLAVEGDGSVFVTGDTDSLNFPVTFGAYQPFLAGLDDAFVTKLNASGTSLLYSTYLGGSGFDAGLGIAVDGFGNAYITGETNSADFPVTPGAFQKIHAGLDDVFVSQLDAAGNLRYSTYLGGQGDDEGFGITLDSLGNAYVTGDTNSLNYPVKSGAFQIGNAGLFDSFVTKIPFPAPTPTPFIPCPGVWCDFDASLSRRTTCIVYGRLVDLALVPFRFTLCLLLEIRDETKGTLLWLEPVIVSFSEEIALCLPSPLGHEHIACRVHDIFCEAKANPYESSIHLAVTLCVEALVEAKVVLLVPAKRSYPRRRSGQPWPSDRRFLLECIREPKVYDWVYDAIAFSHTIFPSRGASLAIQEAVQAGHRIRITCLTSSSI